MVAPYQYSTADTARGRLDNGALDSEIRSNETIAATLSGNAYLGSEAPGAEGLFTVYFAEAIDTATKAALDAVVSAHAGNGHVAHTYPVSATSSGAVHVDALTAEVQSDPAVAADPAQYLGVVLRGSGAPGDEFDVLFSVELQPLALAALDAVVSAHTGTAPQVSTRLAQIGITADPVLAVEVWSTIGGAVVNSDDYATSPGALRLGLYLSHRTTAGPGGELPTVRIMEALADGTDPAAMAESNIPESGPDWHTAEIEIGAEPRSGVNQYAVEIHQSGAASCEVRFASLAIYRST